MLLGSWPAQGPEVSEPGAGMFPAPQSAGRGPQSWLLEVSRPHFADKLSGLGVSGCTAGPDNTAGRPYPIPSIGVIRAHVYQAPRCGRPHSELSLKL